MPQLEQLSGLVPRQLHKTGMGYLSGKKQGATSSRGCEQAGFSSEEEGSKGCCLRVAAVRLGSASPYAAGSGGELSCPAGIREHPLPRKRLHCPTVVAQSSAVPLAPSLTASWEQSLLGRSLLENKSSAGWLKEFYCYSNGNSWLQVKR